MVTLPSYVTDFVTRPSTSGRSWYETRLLRQVWVKRGLTVVEEKSHDRKVVTREMTIFNSDWTHNTKQRGGRNVGKVIVRDPPSFGTKIQQINKFMTLFQTYKFEQVSLGDHKMPH